MADSRVPTDAFDEFLRSQRRRVGGRLGSMVSNIKKRSAGMLDEGPAVDVYGTIGHASGKRRLRLDELDEDAQ